MNKSINRKKESKKQTNTTKEITKVWKKNNTLQYSCVEGHFRDKLINEKVGDKFTI